MNKKYPLVPFFPATAMKYPITSLLLSGFFHLLKKKNLLSNGFSQVTPENADLPAWVQNLVENCCCFWLFSSSCSSSLGSVRVPNWYNTYIFYIFGMKHRWGQMSFHLGDTSSTFSTKKEKLSQQPNENRMFQHQPLAMSLVSCLVRQKIIEDLFLFVALWESKWNQIVSRDGGSRR